MIIKQYHTGGSAAERNISTAVIRRRHEATADHRGADIYFSSTPSRVILLWYQSSTSAYLTVIRDERLWFVYLIIYLASPTQTVARQHTNVFLPWTIKKHFLYTGLLHCLFPHFLHNQWNKSLLTDDLVTWVFLMRQTNGVIRQRGAPTSPAHHNVNSRSLERLYSGVMHAV